MLSASSPFLPKEHLPVFIGLTPHVLQTASVSLSSGRQPHPQSESVTFSEYSPGTLYALHRGTDSHTPRIACLLLCTARQALSTKWAGHALLLRPCTPSRWHGVGSVGH